MDKGSVSESAASLKALTKLIFRRYEPRTYIPPKELQAPVLGNHLWWPIWKIITGALSLSGSYSYHHCTAHLYSRLTRGSQEEWSRSLRLYTLPAYDGEGLAADLVPVLGGLITP